MHANCDERRPVMIDYVGVDDVVHQVNRRESRERPQRQRRYPRGLGVRLHQDGESHRST